MITINNFLMKTIAFELNTIIYKLIVKAQEKVIKRYHKQNKHY